ncbi:hypothetical protein BLNAU_16803 [Blattamonas nauphoetae]|uniref:Uncharacterized protein n=1 Tax=Blattamonas nauphoetae TaxID=2049346 RepID=A0ABQ9XC83_9EUKA|nr:hypothetical protein BLNAU_16803 [Blattamonas nauphoetae]
MSSEQSHKNGFSPTLSSYPSSFQTWTGNQIDTNTNKSVIFQSLIEMIKTHPQFNESLEEDIVAFLTRITPTNRAESDEVLNCLAPSADGSLASFVESITFLVSSSSKAIVKTSVRLLEELCMRCSLTIRRQLIQDGILQKIMAVIDSDALFSQDFGETPLFLSLIIRSFLRLGTLRGMERGQVVSQNEQQELHDLILRQVIIPSEGFLRFLYHVHPSVVDGDRSFIFLGNLTRFIQICPYYDLTITHILGLPVILTITSSLTIIVTDSSIWTFLDDLNECIWEWNSERRKTRSNVRLLFRSFVAEGFDDLKEQRLQNDEYGDTSDQILGSVSQLCNVQGENTP